MENKTLTAVEWLIEEVFGEHTVQLDKEIQQALALERTQIIDSFKEGFSVDLFDTEQTPQDYYTTKYGKQ